MPKMSHLPLFRGFRRLMSSVCTAITESPPKHGKSHFGYKLSVSVDLKHGFIRKIATGTASEHDGHHFEEVLDERNTGRGVYADKAYPSRRRQEILRLLGWRDGMQRRASKRAKVKHVFAGIRHLGGKFIRTIG